MHAASFYYQKHRLFIDERDKDKELHSLARQLRSWIAGKPIIVVHYDPEQDSDEPSNWWIQNNISMAELSRLSCFLLDCPVQAASCERMFKDMSRQSTKGRNRLLPETIHAQTIVLHHLRRMDEDEDLNTDQGKKKRHVNPVEHERIDLSSPTRKSTADSLDEEESRARRLVCRPERAWQGIGECRQLGLGAAGDADAAVHGRNARHAGKNALIGQRGQQAAGKGAVAVAVDGDEISLGRAAEILRIDLEKMRDLSNSWVP